MSLSFPRANSVPFSASDIMMHGKDSDKTERVLFPYTRYDNVLQAPTIITENFERNGAPFYLLHTNDVTLSEEEIRELCGNII